MLLADFAFVGKVDTAQSPDSSLGEHPAMYEAEGVDWPFNPAARVLPRRLSRVSTPTSRPSVRRG
ncbi:MAG: hypothetical protein U0168_16555 [Nannocystaceae bacterium]